MLTISNLLTMLFAPIMSPFRNLPLFGMVVISVVTGILMLIVYKYTSNQKGISRAKDRIKANFLAIMLFSDSFVVLVKSIGSILKWNLVYLGHNLKPLAVMIVPVVLLLIQLNFWYNYRPIGIGEELLVTVGVDPKVDLATTKVSLVANDGVSLQGQGVREVTRHEIVWRIKGEKAGEHKISITVGDRTEQKRVVVGESGPLYHLFPLRHNGNLADALAYPGDPKLTGPIRSILVDYPGIEMNIFGWNIHWIIVYLALSIVFGFSMKGIFKVDI